MLPNLHKLQNHVGEFNKHMGIWKSNNNSLNTEIFTMQLFFNYLNVSVYQGKMTNTVSLSTEINFNSVNYSRNRRPELCIICENLSKSPSLWNSISPSTY